MSSRAFASRRCRDRRLAHLKCVSEYLLKPVDARERILAQRAAADADSTEDAVAEQPREAIRVPSAHRSCLTRIAVTNPRGVAFVRVEDVDWAEAVAPRMTA